MRVVAVGFVVLSTLAYIGIASGQDVQPLTAAKITISATTVDVRARKDMRSDTMLLWNKNVTPRPIGHAILACQFAGTGGILGEGVSSCMGTYVLPLGKITVAGILHGYNRYLLVITGGSGEYKGATGTLFVRRVSNGVRQLSFAL